MIGFIVDTKLGVTLEFYLFTIQEGGKLNMQKMESRELMKLIPTSCFDRQRLTNVVMQEKDGDEESVGVFRNFRGS